MKHIISMLIENESGALSRVAGLFSARGYNIHALTVAPTNDETLSRLTLVTSGTNQQVEQIVKHLNRLIDVVKVVDITEGEHIERELMLIKLKATGAMREEIKRLADIFRGTIVDVTTNIYTVQLVGEAQKLDAFVDAIDDALIVEIVRSGAVGLMRGEKSLHL
ncbi:MAG: acetolactate synthase small subunit [Piscirickettsiaceae bacterium CG_4_9_14_3_um_filter_43_564]|nr:acetolactate synthase small subunit [Thiomicrospira sp.]OIP96771.1 MAG: acetolactate synthase small subunit [Thiomicrospira sp. CG2_30_44_34]PIQ04665.1 MAG: acetolactate synthase small subunit [Piscirickettsiaceae bacterium CG18_big_fil_WC_8_21_14_2_50_44_103]PIU39397.1 MAG: acetolactate synthase small subunit [Piscirickettsiaceae bacterium CG07_land_8_20_14_0_80_44_28]PIW56778.1 MAG: acetolactate synthase small subunit [Piscirickettsiaceae bacterium CG12_big_fil_rev_8_21_14_0_65_44_934]PIW